ncbi:hypothetical protein EV561_103421 [Rhizobium sp. BK376]|nr:hypothetical protein EV561_103421 [Rhizobium sp. BK376]
METKNKGKQENPYGDPREIIKWRMLRFFLFVLILSPLLWLTRGEDEKKPVQEPAKQGQAGYSATAH